MSATHSQVVQQFCIKGEKQQMQQYCLKKSCWVQSQYTQIHFIYIYLKKDAFRGLEGPDPRCFRKTPCHCCPAHGTLGGAQRGQERATHSPALCWCLHCSWRGRVRAGSVCSDAPGRSACISLGACPCTLRHRKAPGAYRKVLEEETSHEVWSQTLTC